MGHFYFALTAFRLGLTSLRVIGTIHDAKLNQ